MWEWTKNPAIERRTYDIFYIYINEDECAFCVFIFFTCLKINRKQYYENTNIFRTGKSQQKKKRGGIIGRGWKYKI